MPSVSVLTSRALASAIALAAIAALGIEVTASATALGGDFWAALRRAASYFTVLTNALVAIAFLLIATGRQASSAWLAGVVLWIELVAGIYHIVLANQWAPEGLAWWSDQGLHTLVPLLVAVWWLVCMPPWTPNALVVVKWMSWPLAYTAIAIVRGSLTGFWPYPFLDPGLQGVWGVGINVFGLAVVILLAGGCVAAFDAWRFRGVEDFQRRGAD